MKNQKESSVLSQYFAISYLLLLINASAFLKQIHYINLSSIIFAAVVYISYCCIYLLPFFLIINLIRNILNKSSLPAFYKSPWFTGIIAVIAVTLVQLIVYTDNFIFKIFGFHYNSFVWNLIWTKGGIESMGNSQSTVNSFIFIIIFILAVQIGLLILLIKAGKIKNKIQKILTRPRLKLAGIIIIVLILLQGFAYGFSSFYFYSPVMTASKAFPFYVPVTFQRYAKKLGLKQPENAAFNMKLKQINLKYPVKPIEQDPNAKRYNIVILMAESLRSDMLNPKVMPKSWEFSEKAIRFTQHYSGGNGTRMGMFAAFYGLYGNYWFTFLDETKGPVLIDTLLANNYQMNVFSSARFSYPEFNKTIFAKLPPSEVHDSTELPGGLSGWQFDRLNVARLLDFIDKRDKSRPFMTFMFFESPHALYYFPPENEICTPYLQEFNYANVDLKKDIPLIKNRYMNSCNHLDSQFARILKYLEDNSLLDSTIVILTGDHGEEFMEKGRWGHNSAFTEEQTRPPLVLWVPGQKPRQVDRMTSHLDIPATLMHILGVKNSPLDYSQGFDLLSDKQRDYTVISGWDNICYVDNENKAVFPMNVFGNQEISTKQDAEVTNTAEFYKKNKSALMEVMKDMSRFSN